MLWTFSENMLGLSNLVVLKLESFHWRDEIAGVAQLRTKARWHSCLEHVPSTCLHYSSVWQVRERDDLCKPDKKNQTLLLHFFLISQWTVDPFNRMFKGWNLLSFGSIHSPFINSAPPVIYIIHTLLMPSPCLILVTHTSCTLLLTNIASWHRRCTSTLSQELPGRQLPGSCQEAVEKLHGNSEQISSQIRKSVPCTPSFKTQNEYEPGTSAASSGRT